MLKKLVKKLEKKPLLDKLLSLNPIFSNFINNCLVVFLYHEVSDNPSKFHLNNNLNVTPNIFYKQMNFIKKNFHIINPQDIFLNKFTTPAALVTFDDGAKGYFDNALPILNELKIPSVHFLNMEPIMKGINWNGFIAYFNDIKKKTIHAQHDEYIKYKEIQKKNGDLNDILKNVKEYHGLWANTQDLDNCKNNNLVFFGSHLFNHFNAVSLSKNELSFQYLENKKYLNNFNNSINFFSYPYGHNNIHYNSNTTKIIRNLGAKCIFTANPISYKIQFNKKNDLFHRIPLFNWIETEQQFKKHLILSKYKTSLNFLRNKHSNNY